jgi:hypothetical protein
MPLHHFVTRVAVLGADTVVGRAICALLEGFGYQITPIDSRPTELVDELLEGADLLLVAPRLEGGACEAFLGVIGKGSPNADMPVIALSTVLEGVTPEGRVESVTWPCETKALAERIEAAILGAPAPAGPASAAPDAPRPGGESERASRA